MALSKFFDWARNTLVRPQPFSWTTSFETSTPTSHLQKFNLEEHQNGLIGLSVEHFQRETKYTIVSILGARRFPPAQNVDIQIAPTEILPLMTKAETLVYLESHFDNANTSQQNQGQYQAWLEQAKAALRQEPTIEQTPFPS